MCPVFMGNFWTKKENRITQNKNAFVYVGRVRVKNVLTGPGSFSAPGVDGLLYLLVVYL